MSIALVPYLRMSHKIDDWRREWTRLVRSVLARHDGAAAVEFALVAAPFLVLLLGMLQVSILFFTNQALETFTETTGRSILTGTTQSHNYSQSQYKAAVCAQLYSIFKCSNLYVDVTTVSAFTGANTQLPSLTFDANGNVTNTWNYNTGSNNSIVVLRLMYQWPVINLPLGVGFGNQSNGSRLLMATAVFKK